MTENQTQEESKNDLRIIDILKKTLPVDSEPRLSKTKLIFLDLAIIITQLIRVTLILAQFSAAVGALMIACCYILGKNPRGALPYLPYFPGLALSLTLILTAAYFGLSAIDESAREIRLIRAYLKYHSFAWVGKAVEFDEDDDDAPIAGRNPRPAYFAEKAGRLLLLTLPVVFIILSMSADWRLPWEAWGWFN